MERTALVVVCCLMACGQDLGLDDFVFACAAPSDCVRGTKCLTGAGVCVPHETEPGCGNGWLEEGEVCDGDPRGCNACQSIAFGWACSSDAFRRSSCEAEIRFVDVAVGDDHLCAITDAGALVCTGSNLDCTGEATLKATPPDGRYIDVAVGRDHSCAVREDGRVVCWGANVRCSDAGGGVVDTNQAEAPDGDDFVEIASGRYHTCAIRASRNVVCWGDGRAGQLFQERARLDVVSAGDEFTCGVYSTGRIQCVGSDQDGRSTPPSGAFTDVGVGIYSACAVNQDGSLVCWGSPGPRLTPPTSADFIDVGCGHRHCCARRQDDRAECWGLVTNTFGDDPFPDAPDEPFAMIDVGTAQACGLREDGTIRCWGPSFIEAR